VVDRARGGNGACEARGSRMQAHCAHLAQQVRGGARMGLASFRCASRPCRSTRCSYTHAHTFIFVRSFVSQFIDAVVLVRFVRRTVRAERDELLARVNDTPAVTDEDNVRYFRVVVSLPPTNHRLYKSKRRILDEWKRRFEACKQFRRSVGWVVLTNCCRRYGH
jgi:hypothetical protein